jgi:hypothetical protein
MLNKDISETIIIIETNSDDMNLKKQ